MSGYKRSLPVVGAVLVILAIRLEELGEGGGHPLGLAHQDVRDGGPLHRSLPEFRKIDFRFTKLQIHIYLQLIIVVVVVVVVAFVIVSWSEHRWVQNAQTWRMHIPAAG